MRRAKAINIRLAHELFAFAHFGWERANSSEYIGRNRSNTQYVSDLYNSFLRRAGDLPGVLFWISRSPQARGLEKTCASSLSRRRSFKLAWLESFNKGAYGEQK